MPARAATALAAFARLHARLGETAGREPSVAALLERVLDDTGYRRMLADEQEDDEEGQDRLANVEELVTAARQFDEEFSRGGAAAGTEPADPLGAFLETTALVADTDVWDPGSERVALMTYHAAKGLEFPVVYLVAMEDGILPHERSLDNAEQLEEERRLVFVGITRGREEVHASAARMRDYRGTRRVSAPSLFLTEMTGSETVVTGAEAPTDDDGPRFDPFGDAARRAATDVDEYSQLADEPQPRSPAARPRADGPVLELDDAPPPAERPRRRRAAEAAIERATDLALRMAGRQPVVRTYEAGQRVRHAEYGEGVIAGISGTGPRAVGTVIFSGPAGTRKFILGHGALEPVEEAS
jgi:DNA helicase-2/ATP-dependent DNA helicase PcrA